MTITLRKDSGMPRWGVNRDYWVQVGDEPFLDRRVLVITPWFGVFWTEIYKSDADERDPHDHSRWFISWIWDGGYTENVYRDVTDRVQGTPLVRRHRRWSLHVMPVNRAHAISEVRGRLRTLVLAGRSRGTWAFWTEQGKVDWRAYREEFR